MPVSLLERDLVRRPANVRRLLAELRADRGRAPACNFFPGAEQNRKILAAHDGNVAGEHYRRWMFRTGAPRIWAQYFEVWLPEDARQSSWALQSAYLTLFELEQGAGIEILGIHCDPADKSNEPTASFKRGPHLHVKGAREPLPRSHFPLNYGHLNEVLRDTASLTKALQDAIFVVRREVLERFGR